MSINCISQKAHSFQMMMAHRITAVTTARNYKRHKWAYERELYNRRLKAGPIKETPRSEWLNWNEKIELYAFKSRISENVSNGGLKQALTDRTHISKMALLVKESVDTDERLGGHDDFSDDDFSNDQMAAHGKKIAKEFIKHFLKQQLPNLPADGIQALLKFLMSAEKLSHVGKHLGMSDLVLFDGFPVPDDAVATSLLALVNLINDELGSERAFRFVLDFIISQLVGEDIDDIYCLNNAMHDLTQILKNKGLEEPVPRLIDQFGQQTAVPCYYVGIYSNEKLIGKAAGETVEIAKDMAARDALMTIYGIQDYRLPLDFNILYQQHTSTNNVSEAGSAV